MPDRILVTGVLGCLGAWVARVAIDRGHEVIGYDLGSDRSRLELVLGADERRVTLAQGDITALDELEQAFDEHEITRVVHLAALQVPFVRASPSLGMRVNVQGTTNVFEAVARRLERIPGLVYASSAAVYNASDPSPAPERGGTSPATLYGVSKLADEGIARVYHSEQGVTSVGLRPLVVYGLGRDQGMTSGPTTAMAAAVRGEPAAIAFSGLTQFDYAPDVAEALVTRWLPARRQPRSTTSRARSPRSTMSSPRSSATSRTPRSRSPATPFPSRPRSKQTATTATSPYSRGRRSPTASPRRWPSSPRTDDGASKVSIR